MRKQEERNGFIFKNYDAPEQSLFDKLLDIFQELITHTSGDFDEAMDWLKQLDKEYQLTNEEYTLDDFVEELKEKGYIREEVKPDGKNGTAITEKTERAIRKRALDQIFGKLKKSGQGNHKSKQSGRGDEHTGDYRGYRFGDPLERISMTESLRNAQINNGAGDFNLRESDLIVEETHHKAQMSTVLMIDISHSMILYGEDRITPAKKVAMALAQLITTRYPKDSLDIIVYGNDSWPIKIKDLPYLQVGPYHTNTVAGLNLAMDIFGLDQHIVSKCYSMARQARKLHIPITTFMIANDPYLQQFVDNFTEANQGKAFYTGLQGLGEMIFQDYETNRKKRIR